MINKDFERALEDARLYGDDKVHFSQGAALYLMKYLALALKVLMLGIVELPCVNKMSNGECQNTEPIDNVRRCPTCDLKKKLGGL